MRGDSRDTVAGRRAAGDHISASVGIATMRRAFGTLSRMAGWMRDGRVAWRAGADARCPMLHDSGAEFT